MKKIFKKFLLGVAFVIVITILLFVVYFIKSKSEIKLMTPIETKEVIENVFAIQDSFVNMFLVKDSLNYIAIDAGKGIDVISEEFKKLDINPDKVVAVLLTHTDNDHSAAISLFKNAKFYFSNQEEQMINGETPRFLFIKNSVNLDEYKLVEDQQTFNIGNIKIQGILTPGHTPGAMCYLINDRYLFTGDILSIKNGKINKFNKFFNMDSETAVKSIERITKLPNVQYIFSGHYGYTDDYKNAVAEWGE